MNFWFSFVRLSQMLCKLFLSSVLAFSFGRADEEILVKLSIKTGGATILKRDLFQKNSVIPSTIGTLFNSGSDCDAYATICGTNGCCQTASLDNKGEQIYQKLILDFERLT